MLKGKKIISLCLSCISDISSRALIGRLSTLLSERGCKLFVYNSCSDLYNEKLSEVGDVSVFNLIDFDVTDVLIIHYERVGNKELIDSLLTRAKEKNVPVIMFGKDHEGCISVSFDYDWGFENVVRHIVEEHGISDVHMISGIKDNEFSERRNEVFRKVLKENGITFHNDMISYGMFWSMPAKNETQKLIDEDRVPRAIICANDAMALAVADHLKENGYRIPEDVIVTGFDGIEEINFASPRITSSECVFENIAEKIDELMPDILEGKLTEGRFYIPPSLLLSQSCGCGEGKPITITGQYGSLSDNFGRYMSEEAALARLGAHIQTATTLENALAMLNNNQENLLYDLNIILKNECIDKTVNPLFSDNKSSFGETMCSFWDSDNNLSTPILNFRRKEIIPNLDRYMKEDHPIIFSVLHFLNIPLGYVAFHFEDCEYCNYVKITQTVSALSNAIGGLRIMRYQKYLNERIEENYRTDALTGLYNRRGFSSLYAQLISSLAEYEVITFMLVDLDGLKGINDKFGHDEGDSAISTVADAMRKVFPPGVICCRFGGDEMAAATKMSLDETSIRRAFDKYFRDYNKKSGKPYEVSASIGIYRASQDESLDFEYLLKKSDTLMYIDKQSRKAAKAKAAEKA